MLSLQRSKEIQVEEEHQPLHRCAWPALHWEDCELSGWNPCAHQHQHHWPNPRVDQWELPEKWTWEIWDWKPEVSLKFLKCGHTNFGRYVSLLTPPLFVLSVNPRFNHWFDGMALLHQFKIANGQVTYKSRFLTSNSYEVNKEHNRIAVSEFGTITMPDPCKNFFQRFLSRFELPSEYQEQDPDCDLNLNLEGEMSQKSEQW